MHAKIAKALENPFPELNEIKFISAKANNIIKSYVKKNTSLV